MPVPIPPKTPPKLWDRVMSAMAEMDTTEMDHVWNEIRAVRERVASLEALMSQHMELQAREITQESKGSKS